MKILQNTLVQHVLNVEQITNDNKEWIVITLGEAFQPLGLFHDKHLEEYKFPTLFFGCAQQSLTCSHQELV
jgi:hypothetical protein